MTSIKKFLTGLGIAGRVVVASSFVLFLAAGMVQAATTISTNISTDGSLTAVYASTTQSATIGGPLWVGGNATTTAAGALTLGSTLSVTGLATFLAGASTTQFTLLSGDTIKNASASSTSISGALTTTGAFTATGLATFLAGATTTQITLLSGDTIKNATASTTAISGNLTTSTTTVTGLTATGNTTLASTTATTMKVGQVGTGMTRIVSGYCVTGSISIPATNASSTQAYANCTPSDGASIITSGDRVFLQATSSLPYYVVIQAASSTAGGLINASLTNFSTSTSPAAAVYAFNFWAFQ